jgi:hypothetical protein
MPKDKGITRMRALCEYSVSTGPIYVMPSSVWGLHYSIEKCYTKFVLLAASQDLPKKMEPTARMEEPGQKRLWSWHGTEEPTSRMNPKPWTLFLDDRKLLLFRTSLLNTLGTFWQVFTSVSQVGAFFFSQWLFFKTMGSRSCAFYKMDEPSR